MIALPENHLPLLIRKRYSKYMGIKKWPSTVSPWKITLENLFGCQCWYFTIGIISTYSPNILRENGAFMTIPKFTDKQL